METFVQVATLLAAAVNIAAAGVGGLRWYRVEQSVLAWRLIRVGQATGALLAVVAGVAFLGGDEPDDGLLWLYLLLPIPVSFVAEQLRAVSAQTVLDDRGLPDSDAMRALPEETQRSIVVQILRKELGVMTLGAFVVAFLALRAWGVTDGL
ncbi:hypothetical protein [Paraconexibacter sp.]|uniref:hypothetical protein n=1 Tax=Paraconexibacter sp. TaxID=2949640 RepID=UPI00356A6F34